MPMLCFFPWLWIGEQKNFGDFELIPYSRGDKCDELSQEELDNVDLITKPFLLHKDSPIRKFTLLRQKGQKLSKDLDEQARDSAFLFSELLAFSCLSIREFFCHGNYCNRDNFVLIMQGYGDPGKGTAIRSRRRDGSGLGFWTQDVYQVQKSEHVRAGDIIKIDEPLLNAILNSEKISQWDAITEAIIFYNLANKDGTEIRDIVEIILLVSAFERLISFKMGEEKALAEAFSRLLVPQKDLDFSKCKRLGNASIQSRFGNSKTVRDIWIRDIFRVRGNHAHGRVSSPYPAVWSLLNHLLLGSFIFPIILKLYLRKLCGVYQMTEEDEVAIEAFEKLACAEHFQTGLDTVDRADPEIHPWNEIMSEITHELVWERIARDIEKGYPSEK